MQNPNDPNENQNNMDSMQPLIQDATILKE